MSNTSQPTQWSIWEILRKFLVENTQEIDGALAIVGFSDDSDKLGIVYVPEELVGTEAPHLKGRFVTLKPIDRVSDSFEITFNEDMGDSKQEWCLEGMYQAHEVLIAGQHILDYLLTGKLPNEGTPTLVH